MGCTEFGLGLLQRMNLHPTSPPPFERYAQSPLSLMLRSLSLKCDLQKSGFREDILIHMSNGGDIIGISYTSPVIALPRPCDPKAVRHGPFDKRTKSSTNSDRFLRL